jgi:hypothetical protein
LLAVLLLRPAAAIALVIAVLTFLLTKNNRKAD